MSTTPRKPWNKNSVLAACAVAAVMGSLSAPAATVAWYRFEEGPANSNVARNGQGDGTFYGAVADSSGNGYGLSAWSDGSYAGYAYNSQVATSVLPLNGAANNFSVKNTGGYPALFTQSGTALQTWSPTAWTVEATFKLENGGYRTIVGRDSRGSATVNGDLAAMYLQAMPNNALAIKFSDVSGYWHEAISANNAFTSFNWGADPNGDLANWYSIAGVSDGSKLSLYLRNLTTLSGWNLIAQTDLTGSGSSNTALSAGTGDGGDWDAGNFSVGRGLYAGGHGDRAWGYIDEVRISDTALGTADFVMVPEPTAATLLGLGFGAVAFLRRRKQA
ncbi:MAG: PEP-CTERM sorting domain-containing protein [Verrucomicrobiota bacterium]